MWVVSSLFSLSQRTMRVFKHSSSFRSSCWVKIYTALTKIWYDLMLVRVDESWCSNESESHEYIVNFYQLSIFVNFRQFFSLLSSLINSHQFPSFSFYSRLFSSNYINSRQLFINSYHICIIAASKCFCNLFLYVGHLSKYTDWVDFIFNFEKLKNEDEHEENHFF